MVSNEDILMQFTAQDDVSSVVEAMESSVTSSLEAISAAMESLDTGLSNLVSSAEAVSAAFDEVETAFDSAESAADSFQSTMDGLSADNISDISSEVEDLDDSFSSAESAADGLASAIDGIDSGSIADVEGEVDGLADSFSSATGEAGNFSDDLNGQDTSALRANMLNDIESTSSSIAALGQTAVESASAAEQGWLRFGNAVNNSGGNWDAQEDSVKSWVKSYSNSMGRGVADTRTAMTTFMNMGMSLDETQDTMKAVSNYAAQFGMSQADASRNIQMAFMGAGRAVKKLGLDIKDFKDEAGNVDKEKLLNAIMEKTSGAADKYANSYEARVQRMNNAINSLKTDFGKEIINTIEPLLPVVQQLFGAFTALPQPIKSAVLAFGGLAGGAAIIAGPLLKMRAYMNLAGVGTGTLTSGLSTLATGFRTLASGGGIRQAIQAMKDFVVAQKAANAASKAGGLGKAAGVGKGMGKVADETGKVVGNAGKVGGMSGAAGSAGAGMQATSASLRGIGQGAMSMLVPLLEIAVVVAVLIPVIAALAAEALIFLKGIQLLIQALNFDSVDLKPAIESIKQIGQALFEIGVAMAAMTFASVITAATSLVNGILGLMNPVKTAGEMLKQAGQELAKFNDLNIDPSVSGKLRTIAEALREVSVAMLSLDSIVLSMALGNILTLGGRLGTVTQAINKAREEIVHASQEIAKIKNLPDIEQGAVDKLKKISESLKSVSEAMKALRSLRDDYNWDEALGGIFKGADIQTALNNVKEDIIKAGNALRNFTGLPDIPEGVGDRLKKIADSMKSVSEAMKSLRSLRDDYNWDTAMGAIFGGVDIPTALNNAKTDLVKVGNTLNSLTSLPDVPDGVSGKVQRISDGAKNVGNTLRDMSNIPFPNIMGMVMIPVNIYLSRAVLQQAAVALGTLQSLPEIPEGISAKVQKVGASARSVASTLNVMSTANFPDIASMAMLPVKITAAKLVLESTSHALAGLTSIQQVPDGIAVQVQKVGAGARSVGLAVQGINTIPYVGPDVALRVGLAVNAVRSAANKLNGLQGLQGGGGIGQALASVRSAIVQLRATLNAMRGGFRASGVGIGSSLKGGVRAGLAGLGGVIGAQVSSGMNAGVGPARSGGSRIGSGAKSSFQAAFKIAQVASDELNYAVQALQSGASALYSTVQDIASQAVQAAKDAAGQRSPGHIARMWGKEMDYSSMMLRTRGAGVIKAVREVTGSAVKAFGPVLPEELAFSSPQLDASRLDSLRRMNQSSTMGKTQRPVSIHIAEGAVQLDARNLTTTESRQVMINALEGLNDIQGIDI